MSDAVLACCRWLENTPWAVMIRGSSWMYPVVLWVHFVGLSMWLGTILTVQTGSELSKGLCTWKWTGFAVACLGGFLLLSAEATTYVTNTGFRLKLLVLIPLALIWHLVVRTKTAAIGRWAGAIEFLLWISVVAASVGFLLTNAVTFVGTP